MPEAVEAIRAQRPDLVFLDVQMPGMNGFEVLETVGAEAMPAVVFVTAYDEFALDAFEVAAVDYLLKPFTEERLRKALARALAATARREAGRESLAGCSASGSAAGAAPLERLLVREGERMFFVPAAEIVRLSAEGNYVRIHTPSGSHELRETLARLESRLDGRRFVRVHRSEIVNLDFVGEIQRHFHGDLIAVLKNGDAVRVSRRYAARLLEPAEPLVVPCGRVAAWRAASSTSSATKRSAAAPPCQSVRVTSRTGWSGISARSRAIRSRSDALAGERGNEPDPDAARGVGQQQRDARDVDGRGRPQPPLLEVVVEQPAAAAPRREAQHRLAREPLVERSRAARTVAASATGTAARRESARRAPAARRPPTRSRGPPLRARAGAGPPRSGRS